MIRPRDLADACALLLLGLAAPGCSDRGTPQLDASGMDVQPGVDAPLAIDAMDATSNAIVRGPVVLSIDADPNGLWWDANDSTLYIADNVNNRILAWRDNAPTRVVADLPPRPRPSGGRGLGQLVRLSDGTFVVTRFGQGTNGDVAFAMSDGTVGVVPNLDPTRQRIGLTVNTDGRLFDVYFGRTASGHVGAVDALTLAGSETDAIVGLRKPVGVLAIGSQLFVSDQDANEILAADIAQPSTYTHFATLMTPDLICAGPDGSLFSGSSSGVVFRIARDGTVTTFDSGYQVARGVAFDAVHRRLFVADHSATNGPMNYLHIVPVN